MKKYLLRSKVSLMLVILILLAGSNQPVKLQGVQGPRYEYVPNEVLVKFKGEIDGAGPNATMYFDEDVDPGETYWYRVKACNPIGDSYPSNVIEVEIFYF